jgi:predicted lipid carrier protein YhbT
MAEEPSSIREALEWLRKSFRQDAARDLRVTYQIALDGDTAGGLWLEVDSGRLHCREGVATSPDVVFHLAVRDFFGILSGRENPDLLFMAERLRVDGDLSLALKLRGLFGAAI